LAKIAVAVSRAVEEKTRNGTAGRTSGRILAQGAGWAVRDVICTCGPQDRPFEEQHSQFSIAIVVAGTFQYRSSTRGKTYREVMTPGSLLLGNPGQYFDCGHEHAAGDRCISFQYAPDYLESIVAEPEAKSEFNVLRLPPLRSSSPVTARACAALAEVEGSHINTAASPQMAQVDWEHLAIELAANAIRLAAASAPSSSSVPPNAIANVTRIVRVIEKHPDSKLTIGSLARESRLSPYHFLRTFQFVTGVTPHQYILRARLRNAAARLRSEPDKILDIALDCGFGDVSNFNRAFRVEFGLNPRQYRQRISTSLVFSSLAM